jgi:hypothetical protein
MVDSKCSKTRGLYQSMVEFDPKYDVRIVKRDRFWLVHAPEYGHVMEWLHACSFNPERDLINWGWFLACKEAEGENHGD